MLASRIATRPRWHSHSMLCTSRSNLIPKTRVNLRTAPIQLQRNLQRTSIHTTSRQSFAPHSSQPFATDSQLLLTSPTVFRPQLPYLYVPPTPSNSSASTSLYRLLSTDTRTQRTGWRTLLYYGAISCGFLVSMVIVKAGMRQASIEMRHSTPEEWSFLQRWMMRVVLLKLELLQKQGGDNWGQVFRGFEALERELEKGLKAETEARGGEDELEAEKIYLEGVGWTGLDVSAKSEPWRNGYHQVLMGLGKAAENMEGKVLHLETAVAYPRECVVGPSNPSPVPLPYGLSGEPPREDQVKDIPGPEKYYLKVATTKGLNSRQRLDAVLAYADWLAYKGVPEAALATYEWGLDIALDGIPQVENNTPTEIIDRNTHVLNPALASTGVLTPNILKASTSIALFHARNHNLQTALPILLSLLKTRKSLPQNPAGQKPFIPSERNPALMGTMEWTRNLIFPPSYPTYLLQTGNEPIYADAMSQCEESALKAYIGEILYATASKSNQAEASEQKRQGLSWTRASVEIAEDVVLAPPAKADKEARSRCEECLQTGLGNWKTMVLEMVRKSERDLLEADSAVDQGKKWYWPFGDGGVGEVKRREEEVRKWNEEEEIVMQKIQTWKIKSGFRVRVGNEGGVGGVEGLE